MRRSSRRANAWHPTRNRDQTAICSGDYARGGGGSGVRTRVGGLSTRPTSARAGTSLTLSMACFSAVIASGVHGVMV